MIKKDLDFGVFYTCFTEEESVKFSLEKLYSLYPTVPVYLISDGGSDYKHLEEKYDKLTCLLEHDSRGFVPKINENNYKENIGIMVESIYTFIDRVLRSIEYCQKPYILIMEPDVLVRGKLSLYNNTDLMGSRVNDYHWAKEQINEIIDEIEGSIHVSHYGSTPAIFSVESFKKVADFFKQNKTYVERFCEVDPNFSNYDIFITVLFAAMGYDEVYNPDLTECTRNPNWETSGHPLLHQFRKYYPKINYTGRHKL